MILLPVMYEGAPPSPSSFGEFAVPPGGYTACESAIVAPPRRQFLTGIALFFFWSRYALRSLVVQCVCVRRCVSSRTLWGLFRGRAR